MPAPPVIVWFRRDLRITDHAPLAAAGDRPVVPLYIADETDDEWAPGAASRWWLHRSLESLAASLAGLGSPLVVRRGDPLAVLRELREETGADTVLWHRSYEPAALARDMRVETGLGARGIDARSFPGALLHEPSRFLKADGTPYRVFTPFWRALAPTLEPGPVAPPPARLTAPARRPASLDIDALGLRPRIRWDDGLAAAWTPGEEAALARLESFVDGPVADYERMRDIPAVDGVSRLSPRLHFGELSPRQVWHAVGAASPSFIREIAWREFAHSILFHFPDTPTEPMDSRFASFPWRDDDGTLFSAWTAGRTGYPLVDAGMRELWHTGWMHNRVRMVVASFLVKNLRLPWYRGARWFWDTLVDADLANNTLGWQWAAGCGADAAPYFRIFNPERQQERFDPDGVYIRRWVPEAGTKDYARPVVDFRASREDALAALKRIGRTA